MSWTAYETVFRLGSPLHIGGKPSGNVSYTLGYVPGWVLWGAVTARLTRDGGSGDYAKVGELVSQNLAFSYFFPEEESSIKKIRPWGKTERQFGWLFQSSYTSTALSDGYTKEDGSLHETEMIMPCSRNGKAVLLRGWSFERDGAKVGDWKTALAKVQLGGERAYGWGRVKLESLGSVPKPTAWELGGERPVRRVAATETVEAHVDAEKGGKLRGRIEPQVRRYTDPERGGFGQRITEPLFCWMPGSVAEAEQRLEIRPSSIWQSIT